MPSNIAARAAICPTAPAPQTATVSPGWVPRSSAPVHPVVTESEANSARVSETSSGTTKQPASA